MPVRAGADIGPATPFGSFRARSSAGEHYLDMVGVTGSIPVAPTTLTPTTTVLFDNSVDRAFASSRQNKPRTLPKSDGRVGKSRAGRSSPVHFTHEAQNLATFLPRSTRPESSDDYPDVVAVLTSRWRVIECSHGIQWILQFRGRIETMAMSRWRGRSYCHTRDALIRCCHAHAGQIEPSARNVLAELPARIIGR